MAAVNPYRPDTPLLDEAHVVVPLVHGEPLRPPVSDAPVQ